MVNNPREYSSHFEAKKWAIKHDKTGHVFTLIIHPDETPDALFHDALNQRYMVALVRMNDSDEPVPSGHDAVGSKAVNMAAMICKDPKFQNWLCRIGLADQMNEEAAAVAIRQHCGVGSRAEFKGNPVARDKLFALRDEFIMTMRR